MAKDLPINPRIVEQLARATVKNLVDGIVELITNSDDSYRRLEELHQNVSGEIEIYVEREKYGICKKLTVKDKAEGMSKKELQKAIEFGGETSGFTEGRSVRGLFGRGLKETIIALGEGHITSIKEGKKVSTRLWLDKKSKKPQYDDELLNREESIIGRDNGTEINITVTNDRIRIPDYKKFKEQVTTHYALRDINSASNRKITLVFDDLKRKQKNTVYIKFHPPTGEKILEKELTLPLFGDKVIIRIYESPTPLSYQRNNPYGLAGILIKTTGAILDNQLFKFENEPAAYYFFGEAICIGLEERLKKGETELIDQNRGGLEWRHDYCSALARIIEKELEPLILRKKKDLQKTPPREVKESTKKMLRKLCNILNELAKYELEDLPEKPVEPAPYITDLQIKPEVANIEIEKPRIFSIYAPAELINSQGKQVKIHSTNSYIQPLSTSLNLEKHPKYPEQIWYKYFKVVGREDGVEGEIHAILGSEKAIARVKVTSPRKKKKSTRLSPRKGGLITDIIPDELDSPPQRVYYRKEDGIIRIYIKFPSVAKFIGRGLEGVETDAGRLLLAELVGEAFCRTLAREGIEAGKFQVIPGSEFDSFVIAVNELQKKYLHKIQDIIINWRFK